MSDNISISDADNEFEDMVLLQWMAALVEKGIPRGPRWQHGRLKWDGHVEQLVHEGKFVNEYLMSHAAHSNLVRLLDPILQR